ncbi:MAG: hypothetical protein LBC62_08890 [Treponema sp.]|jgi:hypothetical protein|nr:hypothetical protein [Treponema sp.]
MKQVKTAALLLLILSLCSCIGVSADIVLNPDNSGTVTLEYRISRYLESLGKQDGNERWLPVPAGKADFERTLERLPGIAMLSFSSKDDGKDLVITVKLRFADMDALLRFLDASGNRAVYVRENASQRLTLTLSKGGAGGNRELADLFAKVSEGYMVSISLDLPSEGTLTAPDLEGAEIRRQGKKLSCSLPIKTVLSSKEGLNLEFRWQ